jgi:hypothetical protein
MTAETNLRPNALTYLRRPPKRTEQSACPTRVWNGIFAAGDKRAKRDLKTISLCRDLSSPPRTFAISLTYSSLERDFYRRRQTGKKGARGDVSKQRPEIGDHDARGMAAKTAFLLASYQLRVSEDDTAPRQVAIAAPPKEKPRSASPKRIKRRLFHSNSAAKVTPAILIPVQRPRHRPKASRDRR